MTTENEQLISIIIVNYNGRKWLKKCLGSLMVQTYKNTEIIFVDNASTDGSVDLVKENYPSTKVLENKVNLGFARGNNAGYESSSGEYVIFLNNDTIVATDYVEKFIRSFQTIPNLGCAQSKIVLMDDVSMLDVCGSWWTDYAFLYHYGMSGDADAPEFNNPQSFFSGKGASMIAKRSIIDEVGLFDGDFWCYFEETDFCHRLWLAGYECWYWPTAVISHSGGGTSKKFDNDFIQFHNFKNQLMSHIKNFEVKTLIWVIPVFVLELDLLGIYWAFRGKPKHFLAIQKSFIWNIVHIQSNLKKRKVIQKKRNKSDSEIFAITKRNPSLMYYFKLARKSV